MDNHFIIEPASNGRVRISLHLNIEDTAVTLATHASQAACSELTMRELEEDLILQAKQRLRLRLAQLRLPGELL